MIQLISLLLAGLVLGGLLPVLGASAPARVDRPNIIVILADDLGYADLGCYGGRISTPNLDALAARGTRFTSFLVPQAVCSASRASLLTGRYPNRVGVLGALDHRSKAGLPLAEWTMAEALRTRGYTTAIFGKWHLGHTPEFLPTRQGFDEYLGLPYSNDMWPYHPNPTAKYPPLPLIRQETVVEEMPDQKRLTTRYTEAAVGFIQRNRSKPFFLYVPHNMPHVPLFVSSRFAGKSGQGLYADVVMELDWSVGELVKAVRRSGVEERTLIVFLSDNGPWKVYGNHAGSAGYLREGKGTAFEGGVRVPMIAAWPGRIPAGRVVRELASSLDMLPTVIEAAGVAKPEGLHLDGVSLWPWFEPVPVSGRSAGRVFYYAWGRELHAVREGDWKLHLPHLYNQPFQPGGDGIPGRTRTPEIANALFDLDSDPGELRDLAGERPEVVTRLLGIAERARVDLGLK